MKIIASISLLLTANLAIGQLEFYSTDEMGELVVSSSNNCDMESLGSFNVTNVFYDIAITPNGTLYGESDSLYKIDLVSGTAETIGYVTTPDGDFAGGAGLVGLNDAYLIGDDRDSLVLISVQTGKAQRLGHVGYYCNGDLAFHRGKLYMADWNNHLIEIILDPQTHMVVSAQDIGQMNTSGLSAYSLFSSYNPCNIFETSLFAIDGQELYLINTADASATFICNLGNHYSYGAASLIDFENNPRPNIIPNVFTPNGDGSNDFFELNISFIDVKIYNRWGSLVFEAFENSHYWDGKTTAGVDLPEGTYYYIIEIDNCGDTSLEKGYVTLMR